MVPRKQFRNKSNYTTTEKTTLLELEGPGCPRNDSDAAALLFLS
jgi:hypothetical protein